MSGPAPLAGAGRVAGAAALIAVLTVVSRLAGFGRTAVFTSVMGPHSDLGAMYVVANWVPNIIFEIVAGGALASLVVPLLAGAVAGQDRAAVAATTGALLTWVVTLLVPLAVLVAVFAGPIITAISDPQYQSAAQIAAGARMLRVFAPQLPLYGIGVVLTGVLQAHRRFAWPVIAPLLSSLTVIAVYLAFAAVGGTQPSVSGVGRGAELLLSGGTTLGVVVLSLSLLIPLRRLRLRLRPSYAFAAEARRKVGGLAVAGAIALTGQQIALLVMLKRVNGGPQGAAVVFNLAQTMFLLPWGVLAVPLAVAAYPTLAAAHAVRDEDAYRRILAPTARRVLLFSCLGAAALVATAGPVSRFFWGADAGPAGGAAIAGFAPGLLGYALFALLTRALYARGSIRAVSTATALGWLCVPVATLGLSAVIPREYRVFAVGLGNSVGMLILGCLLVGVVVRASGRSALAGIGRTALVGVTAGAAAAAVGAAAVYGLPALPAGTPTRLTALAQGMLSGVLVAGVFGVVAYALDRDDARPMIGTIRRRLSGVIRRVRSGRDQPAHPGQDQGKETLSR